MHDSSTTLVGIDIEDESSAMAPTICPNEQVKENTDGFFLILSGKNFNRWTDG
jgi:hypothetical protein